MSNLIPEGSYPASASGGVLAKSSTGKEQIAVACSFTVNGEPVIHTWYGFFTEAAYEKTVESMRVMGFRGDDISDLSSIGSRPFIVVIKHEEYDGVTRAKIAYINDAGGAVKNVMDAATVKSFAASMRAKVASIKPKASAQPGVVHPEPIKDLPF